MNNQDLSIGNDVTMRQGASDALAVIDQFEILRKLGGGGFGSVYLARDTVAGIEVAVKGLPPIVRNNTEELERIRSNFALVSRLHHPYIAAALHLHRVQSADYRVNGVYEELNVGSGDTLMVMEYAPGVTLSQWRKQFPDGKVPLDIAVNLVYQVAQALDYSHTQQILHRDVKPSNIMVETRTDGSFVARVLDFGLAAEIKTSLGRVSMEIHDTSGTRPYMAPEQWAGRKQGPATDQYALACLFCELVTGEVPFAAVFETGDPMVMMTAVCNREVELPADCPRQHALKKALSKDPTDRYASCVEFVESLAAGAGPSKPERKPEMPKRPRVKSSPRRLISAIAIPFLMAAVGAGIFIWHQKTAAERTEMRAHKALESARAVAAATLMAEKDKAAEAEKKRASDERLAAMEAKKAEENRIAKEKELALAQIRKQREEDARRQEQLRERQRIEAEKKICKQCHGFGSVWCRIVCKGCNGTRESEGTRQCKNCKGQGELSSKITCTACRGKGRRCLSCGGKGTVACPACNGKGGTMQRAYRAGIDGRNMLLRKVKVNCDTCGGRGRVRCGCSGGDVFANEEECSRCEGTGCQKQSEKCDECKGTGEIHAKEQCSDCEDGYDYAQKACVSCQGTGKRLLVGDEKPDSFDGISLRMPMKIEYLQIAFKGVRRIPRGYQAQFVVPGADGVNEKRSVSIGEKIGSTGWIFKSYDQNVARKEVPGVSGLFRDVNVSTASLVRSSDGKTVKLQIDAAPGRTPTDVKATLIVCGLDGSKEAIVVTEGKSFRLNGVRFAVKEITMSSVTVEESSTGRKKVISPEYSQSIEGE